MTNEWNEFKAYTEQLVYIAANKKDNTWFGRFTKDFYKDFLELNRILTILARGYLYHNCDGIILHGNAYDRIDYARNALCAWYSISDNGKSDP